MSMKKSLMGMEYLLLNEAWEEVTALGRCTMAWRRRPPWHEQLIVAHNHLSGTIPHGEPGFEEVAVAGVELSLHANLPSELVLLFQYHALELGLLADLPSELGLLLFHQKEAAGDFFESRRLRKLLKMRYFQGTQVMGPTIITPFFYDVGRSAPRDHLRRRGQTTGCGWRVHRSVDRKAPVGRASYPVFSRPIARWWGGSIGRYGLHIEELKKIAYKQK
jgi:hypothetical protein